MKLVENCNGCHCCGECFFREKCYSYDVEEIYGPPTPEACSIMGGQDCSGKFICIRIDEGALQIASEFPIFIHNDFV